MYMYMPCTQASFGLKEFRRFDYSKLEVESLIDL